MRPNRLLAGLALVVMTATPLTVMASADASQHARHAATSRQPAQKAKSRTITMEFGADGATYRLYGKVAPQGSKKAVTLLRATSLSGSYRVFANGRANGQGKFAFTGLAKEGFFRVRVTESSGYATSFSKVVHVCHGGC